MKGNKAKHKDASRRKDRYNKLYKAGFTSVQANRYKDYSDYKIDLLIEEKELSNARINMVSNLPKKFVEVKK